MRAVLVTLVGAAVGLAAGCGGSSSKPIDFGGEEHHKVAEMIDRMNDEVRDAADLKAVFAGDRKFTRADAKKYGKYQYSLRDNGAVTVAGDSATAAVVLSDNKTNVEKEWAFVKEGGSWKLKDAPLP